MGPRHGPRVLDTLRSRRSGERDRVQSRRHARVGDRGGNSVTIVDPTSGAWLLTLVGHTGPVTSVAMSENGLQVAAAADDATIRFWDATSGQPVRTVYGQTVRELAFSPDSAYLLSEEDNGTISVWFTGDPSSVLPVMNFHVDGEGLSSAFAPDGRRIAAVDGTDVRIWDTTTGRDIQRFTASNTNLSRVTFSQDGQRVAVAGSDRVITVWDARTAGQLLSGCSTTTGRPLLTLAGHAALVTDVVGLTGQPREEDDAHKSLAK